MISVWLRSAALAAALLLPGCVRKTPPPPPPHYVLGAAYSADGVWHYPRADYTLDETGLAAVYGAHGPFTADGERFDQTALAAGHPSLQLPALAQLTDLATGRQIMVRVNDRGPSAPGRALIITRRAAALLGEAGDAPIPIRLVVQETPSRAMTDALHGDSPSLALATDAAGSVRQESLAPPPGAHEAPMIRHAAASPQPLATEPPAAMPPVPLRLPEAVRQLSPHPVRLFIVCGAFGRAEYADILRARLSGLGAHTGTDYNAPRDRAYMVSIGPLPDVAAADAMLARALHAGAAGAHIVVQ